MLPTLHIRGLEIDLGLALLLGYVVTLWIGGWGLEFLARVHFHRAQRYSHAGFAYDSKLDQYQCPQGELLTRHTFDDNKKLAVYKAPASVCNACMLKASCTPHDDGRHVYRSLAEFHETDVGRFHRWLSLIVLGLALAFSAGGVMAWWNKPGVWLVLIASAVSLVALMLSARGVKLGLHVDATADRGLVDPWTGA
jgi:hypothetical protein